MVMTARAGKIFSPGLVLLCSCLALLLTDNVAAAALPSKPARKALLRYFYQAVLPVNLEWDGAIRVGLQGTSAEPLEFYTEFLDPAQFPDRTYHQSLLSFALVMAIFFILEYLSHYYCLVGASALVGLD